MKSLDLNLLIVLDALLMQGSVSGAARVLHLSAPAVSHALARIRRMVGDPLLVRAGQALQPTPRALELREPVHRLVKDARSLLLAGRGASLAAVAREFVLRTPDGVPIVYGATLLKKLHEVMPLASLRFVPESVSDSMALREGRIDIDIGALQDKVPEIRSEVLFEYRYVGAVRKGHPLLRKRMSSRQFALERHVALTQRGPWKESVDVAFEAAGHRRNIILRVPGAYSALMAAAQSDLVAAVPSRTALSVAPTLRLKTFPLPFSVPVDRVVQAWHPRLDHDAAHRALRSTVKAVLSGKISAPLSYEAEDLHRLTLIDINATRTIKDSSHD